MVPYWPRDRYLEMAPKYWPATRGRLRPAELSEPISAFEVSPPFGEAVELVAALSAWLLLLSARTRAPSRVAIGARSCRSRACPRADPALWITATRSP